MVEHLATLVENFPGAANQTRCFTHILNLVAKSILHQFDMAKKTAANDPPDLNEAYDALALLADELEDGILDDDVEDDGEQGEEEEDDDDEGLGDERGGMSEEDVAELEQSLIPVRLMLTKVNNII